MSRIFVFEHNFAKTPSDKNIVCTLPPEAIFLLKRIASAQRTAPGRAEQKLTNALSNKPRQDYTNFKIFDACKFCTKNTTLAYSFSAPKVQSWGHSMLWCFTRNWQNFSDTHLAKRNLWTKTWHDVADSFFDKKFAKTQSGENIACTIPQYNEKNRLHKPYPYHQGDASAQRAALAGPKDFKQVSPADVINENSAFSRFLKQAICGTVRIGGEGGAKHPDPKICSEMNCALEIDFSMPNKNYKYQTNWINKKKQKSWKLFSYIAIDWPAPNISFKSKKTYEIAGKLAQNSLLLALDDEFWYLKVAIKSGSGTVSSKSYQTPNSPRLGQMFRTKLALRDRPSYIYHPLPIF